MPLLHAAYLLAAILLLALLTERWRLHPLLALIAVTAAFGFAAGMAGSHIANAFGTGFAQSLTGPGLVIVAASLIGALAQGTGASAWLAAATAGWRGRTALMGPLGLLAGVAASPAAAFALLTPLREALCGLEARERGRASLGLGLALSASHGLVLPAPVAIAATVILGADWRLVLGIGLPLALAAVVAGLLFARIAVRGPAPRENPAAPAEAASGRGALVLLLVTLLLTLLLMVQSLGDIPSEPLGGGANRHLLLGLGRPFTLLLIGVGLMLLAGWRWQRANPDWAGRAIAQAAGLLLLVGAGGGLQKVLQETGMAELSAERLLTWQAGLLLPFLVAATVKTLQGSSLVAAITAAGMTQPLLVPLGLEGETARALAALAVGAGAMTLSHINDPYFWLVTGKRRPLAGLATLSLGTLLQGLLLLAALLVLAALAG